MAEAPTIVTRRTDENGADHPLWVVSSLRDPRKGQSPMNQFQALFEAQKALFATGVTRSYEWRIDQT